MTNWNIPRIRFCHRQDTISHIWALLMQTCPVYCLANREIHWSSMQIETSPETACISVSRVAIDIPISSPSFLCDCFVHLFPLSKFSSQSGERVQEREIVGRSDYATRNFVINGAKRNTNADEKMCRVCQSQFCVQRHIIKKFPPIFADIVSDFSGTVRRPTLRLRHSTHLKFLTRLPERCFRGISS